MLQKKMNGMDRNLFSFAACSEKLKWTKGKVVYQLLLLGLVITFGPTHVYVTISFPSVCRLQTNRNNLAE